MVQEIDYPIHEVSPYINWVYFFFAWSFQPAFATIHRTHDCPACRNAWISNFPPEQQPKAKEAVRLYLDAQRVLRSWDTEYTTHGKFGLYQAWSEGDNIIIGAQPHTAGQRHVIPCLRQQTTIKPTDPHLCLSDFLHPQRSGHTPDTLGIFCSTVSPAMEAIYTDDAYERMLAQTLCDRLAEATAERMHQEIRMRYWGYAASEKYTPSDLHSEKYQGIRPAVGYPSLPDISINHILEQILQMSSIGIHLTENGMMQPHASVSGLLFAHRQSRYFHIGPIGEDQLQDYAERRGIPPETLRRFLIANLGK